jgi:phage/plasmid-associated DNA primase
MTMLYSLSDGAEIDVRPLYQTTFESRRFFSRIAFGCVNLPSVNFTSGGFDRRFKAIQCTAFEGIEGVVGKMLACLEDDTYIERLANWVMDTDREQSLAFMDVSTAVTGVAESARHTMEYQWVDRALTYDSENGCADVTVDDFYQMFMAYCHRNGRSRVTTQTRFTNMIESFGVPVVRGKAERINGKIVTSQDTIGSDNNSGEPIYIDKSLVCVFERSGLIPTSIPHNQFFAQRELVEETIDRP